MHFLLDKFIGLIFQKCTIKITSYDNKGITIGGCSLMMCDIRFQKTDKCKKYL